MEDDVMRTEESEAEILTYIRRLEEQNKQLRERLSTSDTQLARLHLLHDSLLSRIEGVRKALEERKMVNHPPNGRPAEPPRTAPEERSASIASSIMEDEDFKREIREAIQFAKIWKEKKAVEP